MRQTLRITLAALILLGSLSIPLPSARATNDFDYNYTYYDSQQQVIGTWREDCDHNETSWGAQDGEWLQVELWSCATIGHYYYYYHKCSGGWHQVGFVGSTAC
jgi:hypothetical protein